MANDKGVEKLKIQFEQFCEWVREDTVKIFSFFEALKDAEQEDETVKEEILKSDKYKNFVLGIKELLKMIERIIEVIEVAKSMSHVYVFDFDSFQEQLKRYQAKINENIKTESQIFEPLETTCNECFHWAKDVVEYEDKKYHATCINYKLVKLNRT